MHFKSYLDKRRGMSIRPMESAGESATDSKESLDNEGGSPTPAVLRVKPSLGPASKRRKCFLGETSRPVDNVAADVDLRKFGPLYSHPLHIWEFFWTSWTTPLLRQFLTWVPYLGVLRWPLVSLPCWNLCRSPIPYWLLTSNLVVWIRG